MRRAAVLLSHLDGVPAERAFGSAEPFGGEIRDGHVWGRGALDMKGSASRSERPDWTRLRTHP
jgi:acetylornithine deacetylase/succinyl-diaminopimelate desuccinylase-like protein